MVSVSAGGTLVSAGDSVGTVAGVATAMVNVADPVHARVPRTTNTAVISCAIKLHWNTYRFVSCSMAKYKSHV